MDVYGPGPVGQVHGEDFGALRHAATVPGWARPKDHIPLRERVADLTAGSRIDANHRRKAGRQPEPLIGEGHEQCSGPPPDS